MPEYVRGYLDKKHKFWPTKAAAEFSDARIDLMEVLRIEDMSPDFILKFIWSNRKVISEYISTREAAMKITAEDNEVKRDNKL